MAIFSNALMTITRRSLRPKMPALLAACLLLAQPALAKWDHIFVIMMENAGYSAIIGNAKDAPYINNTLLAQAALYTQSFGVTHPSLPNYLALFSGAIQENPANTSNHCVDNGNGPFNAPNLYHSLTAVGKTVEGFFESMDPNDPMACGTGMPLSGGAYVQKHNPFAFFTSGRTYNVPTTAWQPYTGPNRTSWPNFAFIVPNIPNDMHVFDVSPGVTATISERVQKGDTWLANNMPALISYCRANNGLIILTMDEAERVDEQHIPTIVVGTSVAGGQIVTQPINHYNVTKTITDNFGAPAIGHSVGLAPLNPPATRSAKVDFNGDGQSDILWQDNASGARAIWLMKGTARTGIVGLGTVPPSWRIVGAADFNADGKPDILWQDNASGRRAIWLMNGAVRAGSVSLGTVSPSWNIVGADDFNGDGSPDILWQSTSGQRLIWLMNGTVHTGTVSLGTVPPSWSIVGSGDFNSDGEPDILWQNTSGERSIWLMGDAVHVGSVSLGVIPTSWNIAGTGDFNGDGKLDILWQNTSGARAVWLMNGTVRSSSVSLGNIPAAWSIQNY